MKAIILAAGEGSRLRPLTNDRPKCMVEYQGKPILDYQLEAMKKCGVNDIILIKGYKADAFSGRGTREVVNAHYASTNMVATLFCAEHEFDTDLLISYGDILYEPSVLETLLKSNAEFAVAVSTKWRELWEKRMENPLEDAETLKVAPNGNILELGKKPKSYEEIEGQYMGLFKISRKLLPEISKLYREADQTRLYDGKDYPNMYMTSFIQMIIDAGIPVKSVPVDGDWLEIDRKEDLEVLCPFADAL